MNSATFSDARPTPCNGFRVLLALLACVTLLPALAVASTALQARIAFQVDQEPRLEGTDVRIVTDRGNVVLTGQVTLLSQRMLYEQIAWQTRGTLDVDSEIRVVAQAPASDRQLEKAIQALAEQHEQIQNIGVVVKDGVAIVHGTFTSASAAGHGRAKPEASSPR
jgi:osmotically-inducible protein OsmY